MRLALLQSKLHGPLSLLGKNQRLVGILGIVVVLVVVVSL